MNFRVAQDQFYEGDDWWPWSVWIEGDPQDLDAVQEVTYRLHPTFPNPLRTVRTRENKFKLESAGWGGFPILAKIVLKDGQTLKMTHSLTLSYPDGKPNPA